MVPAKGKDVLKVCGKLLDKVKKRTTLQTVEDLISPLVIVTAVTGSSI